MKITTGAGGGQFSGSIGSITAVTSVGRTIFRNKTRPVDRATRRQQSARATFGTLVRHWTERLTASQRESWDNWANQTLVGGKHITGQLAFVRANVPRLPRGLSLISDAPLKFNNGGPVTNFRALAPGTEGSIGINTAGQLLSMIVLFSIDTDDAAQLILSFSRPLNQSVNFFKSPFQFATTVAVASGVSFQFVATSFVNFGNSNGLLVVGQTRAIRLQLTYDDGRLSIPFVNVSPVIES